VDLLHVIAEPSFPTVPHNIEGSVNLLIDGLRRSRCLLVLDDVDTLLEARSIAGCYRAGYDGYRLLFRRVAQARR